MINNLRLARGLVVLAGGGMLLAGLLLLLVPEWAFAHVATFAHEPYNRHYMGDAGAFTIGISVGALLSVFGPERFRPLLLVAVWAGVIHVANHLFDLFGEFSTAALLQDALPNVLAAVAFVWAWGLLRRQV